MSKIITVDSTELRGVFDKHNIPYIRLHQYLPGRIGGGKISVDLDLSKFKFKIRCEIAKIMLIEEAYNEWKDKELNKIIKSMT